MIRWLADTNMLAMPTNEYMASYMQKRRRDRRLRMLDLLGGVCTRCGTTENLEINHIDPTQKVHDISQIQDGAWTRLEEELKKCELLCSDHHKVATKEQWDAAQLVNISNPALHYEHGTPGKYHRDKCRCEPCRAAKKMYRHKELGNQDNVSSFGL